MAATAIAPIYDAAGANDAEAKAQAAEMLRAMRFEGNNYVFVYEYDGTNIVLPFSPERQGTNLIDLQTPSGDYMIRDMIRIAQSGGGFTSILGNTRAPAMWNPSTPISTASKNGAG